MAAGCGNHGLMPVAQVGGVESDECRIGKTQISHVMVRVEVKTAAWHGPS